MIFLGYIGTILTGISLGLIGGGGSILIVPVLVYLFNVSPELATAYSLFVVGIASLVGSYKYAKMNLIEYKTALIFAAPAFIGVFSARRFIIPSLPPTILTSEWLTLNKETLIMLVFAIVMLLASFSMIRKKPSNQEDQKSNNQKFIYNYKMIALEGLGVGTLTGFVGAGGGFLIIPALVLFAKLPMKLAIGTSLIIISAKSLLGFLGDLATSQAIDWSFLIKISFTAIVGIIAGTYLNQFIPGRKLQPAFGWFILVMGTYILARQII